LPQHATCASLVLYHVGLNNIARALAMEASTFHIDSPEIYDAVNNVAWSSTVERWAHCTAAG